MESRLASQVHSLWRQQVQLRNKEKMQSIAVTPMFDTSRGARTLPQPGKYLSFHLGREQFGIPVLAVREIVGAQAVTPVPQTPVHVKGVINLRGKVIPVIDLRVKCGLPAMETTERSCIVVVQGRGGETAPMGILVDGVEEVLNLAASDIETTCDFGNGVQVPEILGLAKCKDRVTILLDLGQILNQNQLRKLQSALQ
jgi:purine-binding chemotaxis protein CheW